MYRYLWRYMRRNKKKLIYTFAISMIALIALICLFPKNFAKFLYNGNVNGVARVPAHSAIRITKVLYLNGYNGNTSETEIIDFHATTMESKIVLGNTTNSNMTYRVTLKNYDLATTTYTGFTLTNDNEDIEVIVSGITNGEQILAGATKEFNVQFKYKDNLASITNDTSNNTIVFNFNNSAYSYEEPQEEFVGNSYLNTQIQLFSYDNAQKDFEVSFVLESLPTNQNTLATMFSNINEQGEPYQGISVRWDNGNIRLIANVDANHKKEETINLQVGNKMVIRRVNGILSYSVDGGQHFTNYADFTGFTNYFYYPATFGAGLDNTWNPYRYFTGTLSHMSVKIVEPSRYTVQYVAVSGTGTMANQVFNVNLADNLNPNTFTRDGYIFDGWNTVWNGTGTSYADQALVRGLGIENQTVMLFAQWKEAPHYTVKFDPNGGEGSMNDQDFVIGTAKTLTPSTYTKTGLQFMNWNTKADGTGTTYRDEESVLNLTDEEDGVVTLYALYGQEKIENLNDVVLNGNTSLNSQHYLFDSDHIHRNFELNFEIVSVGNNDNLSTLVNSMEENYPYPGFTFRINNGQFELTGNFGGVSITKTYSLDTKKVVIRNVSDTLYFSTDGINFENLGDISGITQNNIPLVLGSSMNNSNQPFRYFTGTVRNMTMYLY